MTRASRPVPCPCDSGNTYDKCCGPLHAGVIAPSAEALMRSRYSAYALNLDDYVLSTWHASTRPAAIEDNNNVKWIGLNILRAPPAAADTAIVEFVARYRVSGRAQRLHETSRFVREAGRWYYVDGEFADAAT